MSGSSLGQYLVRYIPNRRSRWSKLPSSQGWIEDRMDIYRIRALAWVAYPQDDKSNNFITSGFPQISQRPVECCLMQVPTSIRPYKETATKQTSGLNWQGGGSDVTSPLEFCFCVTSVTTMRFVLTISGTSFVWSVHNDQYTMVISAGHRQLIRHCVQYMGQGVPILSLRNPMSVLTACQ